MTETKCTTCRFAKVSSLSAPCDACLQECERPGGDPFTLWEAADPDCDTCQHHNTPDLTQCNACTSVAALMGERWTLHVPAMRPKPSARTIPITPAPFAQPGADTEDDEPIAACITCNHAATKFTHYPCDECMTGMVSGKPYKHWTPKIHRAPASVPQPDPSPEVNPSPMWSQIAVIATITFVAGISFGLLIANLRN